MQIQIFRNRFRLRCKFTSACSSFFDSALTRLDIRFAQAAALCSPSCWSKQSCKTKINVGKTSSSKKACFLGLLPKHWSRTSLITAVLALVFLLSSVTKSSGLWMYFIFLFAIVLTDPNPFNLALYYLYHLHQRLLNINMWFAQSRS